jgi:hypothetical protein
VEGIIREKKMKTNKRAVAASLPHFKERWPKHNSLFFFNFAYQITFLSVSNLADFMLKLKVIQPINNLSSNTFISSTYCLNCDISPPFTLMRNDSRFSLPSNGIP